MLCQQNTCTYAQACLLEITKCASFVVQIGLCTRSLDEQVSANDTPGDLRWSSSSMALEVSAMRTHAFSPTCEIKLPNIRSASAHRQHRGNFSAQRKSQHTEGCPQCLPLWFSCAVATYAELSIATTPFACPSNSGGTCSPATTRNEKRMSPRAA